MLTRTIAVLLLAGSIFSHSLSHEARITKVRRTIRTCACIDPDPLPILSRDVLADLEKAVSVGPRSWRGWHSLIARYASAGQSAKGLEYARQALQLEVASW